MFRVFFLSILFLFLLFVESSNSENAACRVISTILDSRMLVEAWGQSGIRVRFGWPDWNADHPTSDALRKPQQDLKCAYDRESSTLKSGNLQATILNGGGVTFDRISDGKKLVTIAMPKFETTEYKTVVRKATVTMDTIDSERLYGLGQHRTGSVRINPGYLQFQKSQLYSETSGADITIPFMVSSREYGFLWNNPAMGSFEATDQEIKWEAAATRRVDYWITTSNDGSSNFWHDIFYHYALVTGFSPNLPSYALKLWQSKLRYRSTAEMKQVVQQYQDRQLEVGVIVLDFFHWAKFGDWDFASSSCWSNPSPTELVQWLRERGVELAVSVWPFSEEGSTSFEELVSQGLIVKDKHGNPLWVEEDRNWAFPGHAVLLDVYNAIAAKFFKKRINSGYLNRGINILWLDGLEPERHWANRIGEYMYTNETFDVEIGMSYPSALQKICDEIRTPSPLMLVRSAWIGAQQYSAIVWSGDIDSTFDEMKIQVAAGLQMSMSGFSWWTTDVGGFRHGNVDDPEFRELLVRWFQYATFSPILRLHGQRSPMTNDNTCGFSGASNEIWSFGPEVEQILTEFVKLRNKLIVPYIQATAMETSKSGVPLMRPLFVEFPDDPECHDINDQYMFGPSYLVAPVLEYQARNRSLYLPQLQADEEWFHIFAGETHDGSAWVRIPAPLNTIPVFEKRKKKLSSSRNVEEL